MYNLLRRTPVLTLLFKTYAIYTITFVVSLLAISAYLAHIKYVESEKVRGDVFSEWAEELARGCVTGPTSKSSKDA